MVESQNVAQSYVSNLMNISYDANGQLSTTSQNTPETLLRDQDVKKMAADKEAAPKT